jgi:quercetin dioxygenase-like cupin family protein
MRADALDAGRSRRPALRACAGLLLVSGCLAMLLASPLRTHVVPGGPKHHAAHMAGANAGAGSPDAARPQTIVRPIACEPLPDLPGKKVTTVIVDFAPHAYSPAHRHPGSVQAYVLHGTLRSQLAGGAAITYRAGETWFEPAGIVHRFAENPAAEPAQLLALFVTDEECGPLVVMEPLQ